MPFDNPMQERSFTDQQLYADLLSYRAPKLTLYYVRYLYLPQWRIALITAGVIAAGFVATMATVDALGWLGPHPWQ
jgi:hypothetical protein